MKIKSVVYSSGKTGFFFDDQKAIKAGPAHDGFTYIGKPVTKGFTNIRQAGESISIMLVLENGMIATGDAAAVQYSGAGGRDPLLLASTYIPFLEKNISPLLIGKELSGFRNMSEYFDTLLIKDKLLHTAVRYGLSQALLNAHALAKNKMNMEIICDEYNLPIINQSIPIFGQSGDDRYAAADKMIIKEIDVLPHALINSVDEKLGRNGEKLKEYIQWLTARIKSLRIKDDYLPAIHIDVYGTPGMIFDANTNKIADYLASLSSDAGEFPLYIEGPIDMNGKVPQIEAMKKIYDRLKSLGSNVKIVADEWCNTFQDIKDFTDAKCCDMSQIKTPDLGCIHNVVESILYCKQHGMESYQGGTCNETDVSARCCVHLAMAARAERMLAKPGMGFDEGFEIVNNEMQRIMALLKNQGIK
jgi:methylaspartate ammonia-lyase